MDLKQLEAFVTVVNHNSFSEAAKHLFLSQPTISAHVASLEKELDTHLISRTTKQVNVTSRGYELYDYAIAILKLRDRIFNEFSESHKKIIDLGASTIPSAYILPELLGAFSRTNPDIYFHSELSDSFGIIEQVQNGKLDFGLVGTTTDAPDLAFVPFLEDELVIVTPVSPHYIDFKKQQAMLPQLITEPFILRETGSGTQKSIDQYFEKNKISSSSLNVVARMNDLELIKRSIINGLGISILSAKSIQDLKNSRQVITFPLDDPAPTRSLYIVHRKDHNMPPHIRQFIQFVWKYYQN